MQSTKPNVYSNNYILIIIYIIFVEFRIRQTQTFELIYIMDGQKLQGKVILVDFRTPLFSNLHSWFVYENMSIISSVVSSSSVYLCIITKMHFDERK